MLFTLHSPDTYFSTTVPAPQSIDCDWDWIDVQELHMPVYFSDAGQP